MSRAKAEALITEEWDYLHRMGASGHIKKDVGSAVFSLLSRGPT